MQSGHPPESFEISEVLSNNFKNHAKDSINGKGQKEYQESPYRWVIVLLVSLSLVTNNLANNAIIPISSKIANVYGLSSTYANAPIQLSFLIYSLMNFPASHFMDVRGLGFSFRMGNALYFSGLFFIMMINQGYHWVVIGSILVALGQPFIMNSPAKVATFWFLNKNRGIATGAITVINIISLGIGLVTPAVSVDQEVYGEQAKQQISGLYFKYFIFSSVVTALIMIFMKGQPDKLPSRGAQQQKTDFFESFQIIKRDRNLWTFFSAFILMYGMFLSFASTSNMLLKPYGFQDTQIAIFALFLLISGISGAIVYTIYIKKTLKYRKAIITACFCSVFFLVLDVILFNKISQNIHVLSFFMIGLGFSFTPLVPISYDLGCQISFPIGQAQIIGILNGGAMLFTFIITISISAIVGFGTVLQSGINMSIYIVIATIGTFLYSRVKMDLKRLDMQKQKQTQQKSSKKIENTIEQNYSTENTKQQMKQMSIQKRQNNDKIRLIKQQNFDIE